MYAFLRMTLLLLVLAATVTAPVRTLAQDEVSWLFVLSGVVQSASSTELVIDAEPTVVAFSDRPERLVRNTSLESFVDDLWSAGADSFADNPPNAAVVTGSDQSEIDVLRSVARVGQTVTFSITGLEGTPPAGGDRISVVIDACKGGVFCSPFAR